MHLLLCAQTVRLEKIPHNFSAEMLIKANRIHSENPLYMCMSIVYAQIVYVHVLIRVLHTLDNVSL